MGSFHRHVYAQLLHLQITKVQKDSQVIGRQKVDQVVVLLYFSWFALHAVRSSLMKLTWSIYLPPCVCPFIPKTCFHFPLFFSNTLLSIDSSLYSHSVISMFVSAFEHFLAFSFSSIWFNFHFDIALVARMAWKLNFSPSPSTSLSLYLSRSFSYSHFLSFFACISTARTNVLMKCKSVLRKKSRARFCCYISSSFYARGLNDCVRCNIP